MSIKSYTVVEARPNEYGGRTTSHSFPTLAQALIFFGRMCERWEGDSARNLLQSLDSIKDGDMDQYSYVVAWPDGGDMIADARVWIKVEYQYNYST